MIRTIFRLLLVTVVLAAALGGFAWYRATSPYQGFSGDEVFVELPAGAGVSGIAARLTDAGVIPDPITFRLATRWAGKERRLQAGEYRFAGAATEFEVIARLAQGALQPAEQIVLDLVVIDECHRGSADEDSAWRDILDYFTFATHIGLTATPTETKDVSNEHYFGKPLYTYSLRQGIDDGFHHHPEARHPAALVAPDRGAAGARRGKPDALPPEARQRRR
jgi:hypothetical protein